MLDSSPPVPDTSRLSCATACQCLILLMLLTASVHAAPEADTSTAESGTSKGQGAASPGIGHESTSNGGAGHGGADKESPEDDTPEDDDRFFKPGGVTVSIFAGDFISADEPQFVDLRAEYSLGMGISADLNIIPHLALDFEIYDFSREYTTQVVPEYIDEIDNDTKVQTNNYLFGARAYYQVREPLRVYGVLGFGYFETTMLATGSWLGLPATHEDSEWSIDMYAGAGIIYMLNRWGLGLDYRYFDLQGDFADFEIYGAEIGGEAITLSLHYRF